MTITIILKKFWNFFNHCGCGSCKVTFLGRPLHLFVTMLCFLFLISSRSVLLLLLFPVLQNKDPSRLHHRAQPQRLPLPPECFWQTWQGQSSEIINSKIYYRYKTCIFLRCSSFKYITFYVSTVCLCVHFFMRWRMCTVHGSGQRLCALARWSERPVQSVSLHALGSRCQQHCLYKWTGMDHISGLPLPVDVSMKQVILILVNAENRFTLHNLINTTLRTVGLVLTDVLSLVG